MLDPTPSRRTTCAGSIARELDEAGAYAIGRAYVEQFEPARIAVGRDMRLSSPSMAQAVREGAADGGADVLDLGMVGTEMVYFAVGELALDGGIAVTASHNPKEYTGMKIVRRGALAGGRRVRACSTSAIARARGAVATTPSAARSAKRTSGTRFVERVLSFVDVEALRPLRVVIDAANGMAGAMLPPVLDRLPMLDVVRCYFEPDGSFPNHEPNPLLPENREFIIEQDDRARGPTSASRTTATLTAASSSTTPATSSPATSRPRCSRSRSSRRSRAAR